MPIGSVKTQSGWAEYKGASGIYSFDSDLDTEDIELLPIK